MFCKNAETSILCDEIIKKNRHFCWTPAEAWPLSEEDVCKKCQTKYTITPAYQTNFCEKKPHHSSIEGKHRRFYVGRIIKERKILLQKIKGEK